MFWAFRLFLAVFAFSLILEIIGIAMAAMMPMTAITTSNSTREKPAAFAFWMWTFI